MADDDNDANDIDRILKKSSNYRHQSIFQSTILYLNSFMASSNSLDPS